MGDDVYLALDIGSSRLKAALLAPGGGRVGARSWDVDGTSPAALAAGVDASIAALAWEAAKGGRRIRGLGMAVQMAGLLLLDDRYEQVDGMMTGTTPGPAGAAEALAADVAATGLDLHQRTGCPIQPYYPAPKARAWAAAASPAARARVRQVGDLKAYLLWSLTGSWTTDPATASATQLFDRQEWRWLPVPGVPWPISAYPRIRPPWEIAGAVDLRNSQRLGLPRGLPVIVGTGDGPAMSVGAGLLQRGEALLSLGTTTVVRWAEQAQEADRVLAPDEFRQALSPDRLLCGCRSRPGDASLDRLEDALRRAVAREGLTGLQLTGGGAADPVRRAAARRLGLPVRDAGCPDATAGVGVLVHMALESTNLDEAMGAMASVPDSPSRSEQLDMGRRP